MRISILLPLVLFAVSTFPTYALAVSVSPSLADTTSQSGISPPTSGATNKEMPSAEGLPNQAPGQPAQVLPHTIMPMTIEPNPPGHPHPVGDPR